MRYRFRPKLVPTLATLALLPLLVHLGQWQYAKAQQKFALQQAYEAAAAQPPFPLGAHLPPLDQLRYRRVALVGEYEPRYQILLDNQVHREAAGYHVITPLRLAGSDTGVLVDRGWVPAGPDRNALPQIATPAGRVEVQGSVWLPPGRTFTLDQPPSGWQPVWQAMDLARYRAAAPFPVHSFLVRLDPASGSGFVREWPRLDARAAVNLGYAYQWFGMAVALVAIYLTVNWKKEELADGAD